jgi:hypothetical protein
MNIVTFPSIQTTFYNLTSFIIERKSEWFGYVVTKVRSGLTYLEDPRLASVAIFLANFPILELAHRICQLLVGMCLSNESSEKKTVSLVVEFTLGSALVIAGNMAFIKLTNISLSPYVIAPIVVATFMIKSSLENYLEQPTAADKI